jgi:alkylated DNA repair dioxygenase AlkB
VPPVKRVTPKSYLGPLLAWIEPLALRLVTGGYFTDSPDHVIANEYLPGQGISAHVDCEPCFGPVIASLSLLSPCEMVFRKLEGGTKASIILEPRCLVILSGEGRYNWTHEIPARKSDVIDGFLQPRGRGSSLTFRKTIGDVCAKFAKWHIYLYIVQYREYNQDTASPRLLRA